MHVESINAAAVIRSRANEPAEEIDRKRQEVADKPEQAASAPQDKSSLQPEELLTQIKALTEDGLYSVRFEKSKDTNDLIVKVVDAKTDEVVRQIPPEELVNLSRQLEELRGNLVDTVS